MTSKAEATIKQTGLHQNLKLSCFKGHDQENEKNYQQNRRKYVQIMYLIRS